MIRRITLQNFRRHADTTIDLSGGDAQVVAIAGRNGTGKTTLLEAICFALYGEGREGRRNLDRLIRRGAGPEGMEVTLEFEVAGTDYRISRRRDGRSSTATLWANDAPVVEKTDAVTDHVTKLFGLDAMGFRLAVIAQQKELDGLASLRPGERAKMLSRLLRLDSIAEAKQAAAAAARDHTNVVKGIGDAPDLAACQAALTAATDQLEAAKAAEAAAHQQLTELQEALAGSVDVERDMAQAQRQLSAAEGRRDAAQARLAAAAEQLAAHPAPDRPGAAADPAALQAEIAQVNIEIEQVKAARRDAERMAVIQADHDEAASRVAEIDQMWPDAADTLGCDPTAEAVQVAAALAVEEAQSDADRTAGEAEQAAQAAAEAASSIAVAEAAQAAAVASRADADGLEATCDRCDQTIGEDHRAALIGRLEDAVARTGRQVQAATDAHQAATERLAVARKSSTDAAGRLVAVQQVQVDVARLIPERERLVTRIGVYATQLEAAAGQADPADLEGLLARRADLDVQLGVAQAHAAAVAAHQQAAANLVAAQAEADQADRAVTDATIDPQLETAWLQRQRWSRDRADAADLYAAATAEVRVAAAAADTARERVAAAEAINDRLVAARHQARVQGLAREVLGVAHARMSQRIRPALQGVVVDLITQMSDGRFTDVEVTADYDILVADDGRMRPLTELSGGEQDLVALAVRLGLASVVIDRHGAAAPGFLILDECFGSQDAARRTSIMTTLRTLRARYGQILLISHVGGLEEAADRIIDLTVTDGVATAALL